MVSCFNLLRGAESDPAVQTVGRVVTDTKKEDDQGSRCQSVFTLGTWELQGPVTRPREVHAGAKYRRMRSALTMCRIGAKRGVSAVGREA